MNEGAALPVVAIPCRGCAISLLEKARLEVLDTKSVPLYRITHLLCACTKSGVMSMVSFPTLASGAEIGNAVRVPGGNRACCG